MLLNAYATEKTFSRSEIANLKSPFSSETTVMAKKRGAIVIFLLLRVQVFYYECSFAKVPILFHNYSAIIYHKFAATTHLSS